MSVSFCCIFEDRMKRPGKLSPCLLLLLLFLGEVFFLLRKVTIKTSDEDNGFSLQSVRVSTHTITLSFYERW